MKKHWIIGSEGGDTVSGNIYTLEEAVEAAKRRAASRQDRQIFVYEAVQGCVRPVPPIEMKTL